MSQTVRRRIFFVCGLSACLAAAGCLPDPDITIPDFGSPRPSDAGMVLHMDGPSGDLGTPHWAPMGMVSGQPTVRGAYVVDPGLSEVYLVGHSGLVLHRVGDGAWQTEMTGVSANLYAMAANSTAEIYAVGENGTILRRAAGAWQQEGKELHLTTSLFGVTTLTSGEVVAVGDLGVVARRQTGGVWISETSAALTGTSLRAVWGSQIDSLYTVGLGSTIVRRMGGTWQRDSLPIDPQGLGNYYAITGSSVDDVHIAGEYGLLLHRASDRWTAEKLTPPMGMTNPMHFYSLYLQGGELLVSGAGGVIFDRKNGDSMWTIEPSGSASDLYSLAGAGLRSVVAVGSKGTVLRRM